MRDPIRPRDPRSLLELIARSHPWLILTRRPRHKSVTRLLLTLSVERRRDVFAFRWKFSHRESGMNPQFVRFEPLLDRMDRQTMLMAWR
jgi:hypothetical protein